MGVVVEDRDNGPVSVWCEGCGRRLRVKTNSVRVAVDEAYREGWQSKVEFYGYCELDGRELLVFEHFCSDDCLDPPEWDDG